MNQLVLSENWLTDSLKTYDSIPVRRVAVREREIREDWVSCLLSRVWFDVFLRIQGSRVFVKLPMINTR